MMHLWRLSVCLSSEVCLTSVAYIGPKSWTERPRKTKIGTKVAHITRDSDTTFKVKRSKVNLQGAGVYFGSLPAPAQLVNKQIDKVNALKHIFVHAFDKSMSARQNWHL